jgi:hypothetical protein
MRIINALRGAEHWEYRVYGVPNGFALVTKLEQIDKDGAPLPPRYRFIDPDATEPFSITDFLRKLYIAPPGRYRLIVFIVSDERFQNRRETLARADAKSLMQGGSNDLESELGSKPFTPAHVVTALIYEFVKEHAGKVSTKIPGETEAINHFRRSNIALIPEPTP